MTRHVRQPTVWLSSGVLVAGLFIAITVSLKFRGPDSHPGEIPVSTPQILEQQINNSVMRAFDGGLGQTGLVLQTSSAKTTEGANVARDGVFSSGPHTTVSSHDMRLRNIDDVTPIPLFLRDASQPEIEAWLDLLDSRDLASDSVSF